MRGKLKMFLMCFTLTFTLTACNLIGIIENLDSLIMEDVSGLLSDIDDLVNGNDEENNLIISTDLIDSAEKHYQVDHNNFGVDINQPSKKETLIDKATKEQLDLTYADGINIRDKYNENYVTKTPSRGTPKFLVVPVLFNGEKLNEKIFSNDDCRKWLTKSFFGKSYEVDYESVSSYYSKASFGACNIIGEVSPVFTTTANYDELYYADNSYGYDLVDYIIAEIYDCFFNTGAYKISDFDSNNDNVIDGICAVYLNNTKDWGTPLWTYVTTLMENQISSYHISNYMWASFNDLYNLVHPNTNTLIHETGHMFGLDDYYNYYDQEINVPAGGINMMDYNVGGQDSFSCYSLGWTVPHVIDKSITNYGKEIYLEPFEKSGDCLIIANDFNNTSFDEYLMIEYYTPTGLNEYNVNIVEEDSNEINKPGIAIYHIDQRLAHMVFSKEKEMWEWNGEYQDRIYLTDNDFSKVAASNARSIQGDQYISVSGEYLISLLDSQAKNGYNKFLYESETATAANLFHTGDLFSNSYPYFQFNDGTYLDFDIYINDINDDYAKLSIMAK